MPGRGGAVLPMLTSGAYAPVQRAVERLIALGYGLTYDGVVRGFPPYESLLDEITSVVARASGYGSLPCRSRTK